MARTERRRDILEGARSRLKVLGMMIRRGISVGTAVDPSTEIVSIADLSSVWVLAEAPESDIPDVGRGTGARLTFPASGLSPFEAKRPREVLTARRDAISEPLRESERTYKGFNFFNAEDRNLLFAIIRGEHVITGFRHADSSASFLASLPAKSPDTSSGCACTDSSSALVAGTNTT